MIAALITNLAIVVLPICCLALLVAIGIQLDFGEPEYAGPRLYRNVMSRQEQEQRDADRHAEIQAQRRARHERHEADEDWKFNTEEWNAKLLDFLDEPVGPLVPKRSMFGTPEVVDEWVTA